MNGMASSIAVATAWALVHFLWQGTLVGLAAGGVLSLLERRSASLRYALAVGALLLMAALPAITAVRLAVVEAEILEDFPAAAASPGSAGILPASSTTSDASTATVRTFGGSLMPWVLGLWLAGVAFLSTYHLGGWSVVRRLSRQGQPIGGTTTDLLHDLCRRLGIRRPVALLESLSVSVPVVVGWLRPVVLVPASALAGLSPVQLEAILAHELAHVRRHDYLVNLFQTAVETLLFYHPAVWWVSSQVRRERENCCDDLAVAVCGNRLSYARALVDLEGLRSPRLALAATGGSLSERVQRLVGVSGRPRRRAWAAGLLALALLPAGAAVQLACSRETPSKTRTASAEESPLPPGSRRGRWTAHLDDDGAIRTEMTFRKPGWGTWTSVDNYPEAELEGLTTGPDVRFELRRDAGTFRFRGRFDGRKGGGTVVFTGNPLFAEMMGLPAASERLMELTVQDITFAFTREMKDLGIGSPQQARRTRNDSPVEFIHEMFGGRQRRASFIDQLLQLRTHQITPAYVRGMQEAGYPRLSTWQLVDFRIHGIEPGYVKGLRDSGYRKLYPYRVVQFRIHGITPEWLRGIVEAGHADASPDQILSMHNSGVNGGRQARLEKERP